MPPSARIQVEEEVWRRKRRMRVSQGVFENPANWCCLRCFRFHFRFHHRCCRYCCCNCCWDFRCSRSCCRCRKTAWRWRECHLFVAFQSRWIFGAAVAASTVTADRRKLGFLVTTVEFIFKKRSGFSCITWMEKKNKKTKTRSLDLSRVRRHFQKKVGRQTDKHFFFKKTFEIAVYSTKFLFHNSDIEYALKSL